jgi:4-hydroxybenzoate polyprenyltransferase
MVSVPVEARAFDRLKARLAGHKGWLELCRLQRAMIAAGDPLAGALLAGAGWMQLPAIAAAMTGVLLMHAGAWALDDWHSLKLDRTERPERPIPSGQVNRWSALGAGVFMVLLGYFVVTLPGTLVGQAGVILFALILIHQFMLREIPLGLPLPALARAAGFWIGTLVPASVHALAPDALALLGLLTLGTHALGIAVLDQRYIRRRTLPCLVIAGTCFVLSWAALVGARIVWPSWLSHPSAAVGIGVLLAIVGSRWILAFRRPDERAVHALLWPALIGSLVLEATLVAFVHGWPRAIPIVLWLALAGLVQRQCARPAASPLSTKVNVP